MTTVAAFLRDQIGYSDERTLRALDALAGKKIGRARFYADLDECRTHLESSLPLFVLPFAHEKVSIGLHLRPSDVAARRLALIEFDEELVEVASTIDAYVFRALARLEYRVNRLRIEEDQLDEGIALATSIFGSDFYVRGRIDQALLADDDDLLIERFGGSVRAWSHRAVGDDPAAKLRACAEGLKVDPHCLHFHAAIAATSAQLGDRSGAADAIVRSLGCYHHTAYVTNLEQHYELGRALLDELPDRFSAEQAWDLRERDMIKRTEHVGALYHAGQIEAADKLLNDNCYDVRDYDKFIDIFRKHYERLGWRWALALCDLRR